MRNMGPEFREIWDPSFVSKDSWRYDGKMQFGFAPLSIAN